MKTFLAPDFSWPGLGSVGCSALRFDLVVESSQVLSESEQEA